MNLGQLVYHYQNITPIPERCTLITDLIGQVFALSFFIATFAGETISIAGGDACVPGQAMVRPIDRTSLIAGGDACVPGHSTLNYSRE